MALTRKLLAAMGIEADKVEEIIQAHTETVNGLKDEAAKYKGDAEKLPEVQKELDKLKEAAKDGGKNPFEVKYNALKEEFEAYKGEIAAKEAKGRKDAAYKALLKEAGVSEKRIEAVLRVSDVDSLEFDDGGKVKNHDDLITGIKGEWADFIETKDTVGASTPTPPSPSSTDYDGMSDADYYKATYEAKKG